MLFLAPSITLAVTNSAAPVKMDRIIAIVDQGVITEQELTNRMQTVSAQLQKQGTQLPPPDVLEKQILERLIVDSLQLQLAAQTGIKVDDTVLDKTIERIAAQNKMDVAEFKDALEKDGLTLRLFREDIRNEITMSRLRERDVDNKLTVTDGEIDNFLTTQANRGDDQDEFEISHILIRAPEDSSPEDIQKLRTKTEAVLKELA
ncbi:MAG: SurA N-terminal domain-containing protein, partial [Pseudomonadota bacterium]